MLNAVTYWYCDGDFSQADLIKSLMDLIVNIKVISNKRMAVKHPADLAKVFLLIKAMLPAYLV